MSDAKPLGKHGQTFVMIWVGGGCKNGFCSECVEEKTNTHTHKSPSELDFPPW